jgi:hypothetical protein
MIAFWMLIILMMEVVSTSEMSVSFYQNTWCNISEEIHLHTRCCENLKSLPFTLVNICSCLQHLIVTVKNLSITIEERLLLKLFLFAGYNHLSPEQEEAEESDFEVQRILTEVTSVHAKKYYFGLLKLEPGHVCITSLEIMLTAFAANNYLNVVDHHFLG